jgi:outer membrane lipoprotein-sorting protein
MKGLIVSLLLVVGLVSSGFAQYTSAKDSDPEALALLTKAGKSFSTKNARVNFKLKLTFPGQEPQVSDGILYRGSTGYRLELKDYHIISDGTTRWVYLKGPNELNIYNESNAQDWISPQDFLQLHTSKDLVFTLAANKADGTSIILAKPLKGRFDEYSKFTIGIRNGALSYINAISSDGTKQDLTITSVTNPDTWDHKLFTFNTALYPDIHVEDLRLD